MSTVRNDRGLARLHALVDQARDRAIRDGRAVLVSLAEPARIDDVLGALERILDAASRDAALEGGLGEGAAYWARPADGFELAGAGSAARLSGSGVDRFRGIDAARASLEEGAIVEDPSGGMPGVGPVLMGGFAFDDDGPRTAVWEGFPAAMLAVPRLQIARSDAGCWVTMTLCVEPGGHPDVEPAVLARLRDIAAGRGASRTGRGGRPTAPGFAELPPGAEWRALVAEATAEIRSGAMDKVVLARSLHARGAAPFDALAALRQLRTEFPSTHVFGFWRGERAFIGATPERLVQLDGDTVRSSSLAGSIRRGGTADEDRGLRDTLLASAKDRSEHELVRTALCRALAVVCHDVTAPSTPTVLTLPQVHHLHTPVTARLRPGRTLLEVVERLHPTPAVGGAPREAALHFIRAREPLDRGWYASPVGWMGRGRGEFAVALRSAVVAGRDAWLFAGCGIVAASDPAEEYDESALKLRPMQEALGAGSATGSAPALRAHAAAGGDGAR